VVEVLGLLATGALAGWVAGTLTRGAGFGLVVNIVVGIIGGIIGGGLSDLLGIDAEGWLASFAMAVVGAVVLLVLVNLVRSRPAQPQDL
jgi:uncharacterized membrane protein YeaQ/YmgE (transglycosylase-associated protein family)